MGYQERKIGSFISNYKPEPSTGVLTTEQQSSLADFFSASTSQGFNQSVKADFRDFLETEGLQSTRETRNEWLDMIYNAYLDYAVFNALSIPRRRAFRNFLYPIISEVQK